MGEMPRIEAMGDHRYLASLGRNEDLIQVRVEVTPEVLEEIGATGFNEEDVAAATIAFLTDRQRPDELPPQLDLEQVSAVYDDFADTIRAQLSGQGPLRHRPRQQRRNRGDQRPDRTPPPRRPRLP